MYTIIHDDTIQRIVLLRPSQNPNRITVRSISSPEDVGKNLWGQITYDLHVSEIFDTEEKANKEIFVRALS